MGETVMRFNILSRKNELINNLEDRSVDGNLKQIKKENCVMSERLMLLYIGSSDGFL
jgi:hypothetical protein